MARGILAAHHSENSGGEYKQALSLTEIAVFRPYRCRRTCLVSYQSQSRARSKHMNDEWLLPPGMKVGLSDTIRICCFENSKNRNSSQPVFVIFTGGGNTFVTCALPFCFCVHPVRDVTRVEFLRT